MSKAIGAVTGTNAYDKAAKAATNQSTAGIQAIQDYTNQATSQLSPYVTAGTGALGMYQNLLGLGQQGTAGMNAYQQSPGYQFRLQQGVNALDNSASASGSLLSGAQQKALLEYGQNFGSNEYQNYLGNVSGLTNLGYDASNQTASLLANAGGNIGSIRSGLGATLANTYNNKAGTKADLFKTGLESITSMALGDMKSGGSGGLMGMLGGFLSDINLKQNIKYTGKKSKDGFNIIEFNYNNKSGLDTSKRYRGLIAQEVELLKPEAVIEKDGYKTVDYSKLDIKMEEI